MVGYICKPVEYSRFTRNDNHGPKILEWQTALHSMLASRMWSNPDPPSFSCQRWGWLPVGRKLSLGLNHHTNNLHYTHLPLTLLELVHSLCALVSMEPFIIKLRVNMCPWYFPWTSMTYYTYQGHPRGLPLNDLR